MKKILLFIFTIIVPSLLIANEALANQNDTPDTGTKSINLKYGAGASLSTNGFGINIMTEINDRFNVRLGYEYINLSLKKRGLTSGGHFYYIHPKYKTGGFSLIAEAKVYKSFYVAAGLVQTSMSTDLKMKLKDGIKFGDISYTPDEVGELKMKLKPKNKIAPYLGVGWTPKIFHNERMKLNIEVGTYYINSFKAKMSGTNMLAANNDSSLEIFNDEVSSMSWTKFYPIGRIGFTYIIF